MINAVVMASGSSKRMGTNKLFLTFNKRTLIENTLDIILKCGFSNITLVSSYNDVLALGHNKNLNCVYNQEGQEGKSSSIKLGINSSPPCDGFMFFPSDQPFLDVETIKVLMGIFEKNKNMIIIPSFKGQVGSPVIFPSGLSAELLNLKGDLGGKNIIKNYPDNVLYIEVENENFLMDIDTKEDYEKIISRSNSIIVRGGGDIASGTIHKLHNSGFNVLVLEAKTPTAIRRKVSFCEAIYEGSCTVEGITAIRVTTLDEVDQCFKEKKIPVLIDPQCKIIPALKPMVLVDGILAKENKGTNKSMAPITIALGPGFNAGADVDIVIETLRGHNLGKLIFNGYAEKNTGIPGKIKGFGIERVSYSPIDGIVRSYKEIGEFVTKGEPILNINSLDIVANINGFLRGSIRDNIFVKKGTKLFDIDPRVDEPLNCFTISEKARNIAGGVLEAILYMLNKEV